MKKEEFMNFWVKNPNELMPNPLNKHEAVIIGELFMKQLNEIIDQAIAEHEQSQWKKYPENKPEDGWEGIITGINKKGQCFSLGGAVYSLEEGGFFGTLEDGDTWDESDFNVIAFRELPEPYKEGGEG